jgi:peroxiredoxin
MIFRGLHPAMRALPQFPPHGLEPLAPGLRLLSLASLLSFALLLWLPSAPARAGTGGATYTPGTDQHLTEQGFIGAKTRGYSDCGRAAEADLKKRESSKTYEFAPEIKALIGTPAPEFADDLQWANCPPLTMAKLRGHPVFIRFWYRNCAMCQATAPVMNELYDDYAKDGLVVIGIHHAKTSLGDKISDVAKAAEEAGFKFPVAVDNSWHTVSSFWIRSASRAYSSASFLIDKNGIIVWGHDMGRLEKGTPAVLALHDEISKLLGSNDGDAGKGASDSGLKP